MSGLFESWDHLYQSKKFVSFSSEIFNLTQSRFDTTVTFYFGNFDGQTSQLLYETNY